MGVMSLLAQSIAAMHGLNVMTHSDIRLFTESAQDLPPVSRDVFGGEDCAQETIRKVIRKGSKRKKRKKHKSYHYGHDMSEDTFIQRDAVVETLISHCQILGHQLSFCFKPITEADMIQHIGVGGFRFN